MKPSTFALILAVAMALVASFWLGGEFAVRRELSHADTVYVDRWVRDTVYESRDSIVYKIKPVYLAVHDTTEVSDTVTVRDSVLVDVPIVEKTYIGDNYRATVRGFRPELVDIWVRRRETTITVPYRKRWSFTVGPQVGVGITPQGWQPYAGAGATFGYSF